MKHARLLFFCCWVLLVSACLAPAQLVCTWKGGTNVWSDPDAWTNGVPGTGDTAIVARGAVLLQEDTAPLAAFTLKGGTLTFSNWTTRLTATDVFLQGGVVNHAICNTNMNPSNTNRVFFVCTNMVVASGGKITVDDLGYRGGTNNSTRGQGPGGGLSGGGGGYGGRGAAALGNVWGPGGGVYGSVEEPDEPGSGGGGSSAYTVTAGLPGGGVVRIEASGTVTVNGSITASAARNSGTLSGKGSGGSISIRCRRFASTNGTVRADGGGHSGIYWIGGTSGGGGRIAIAYDPASQAELNLTEAPRLYLSADGGNWVAGDTRGRGWNKGGPGSLYLPDTGFYPAGQLLNGGSIEIPGFTNWAPQSVTFSNGLTRFPPGFSLVVTNDLTVLGHGGGFEISNGTLRVQGALRVQPDIYGFSFLYAIPGQSFAVDGDLLVSRGELNLTAMETNGNDFPIGGGCILTNSGRLRVFSAVTNGVSPDYGALLEVGGDVTIHTGSWLYAHSHYTNGGSPLLRMANLTVMTNAGISAVALGFEGGNRLLGYPGRGPGGGAMYGGGGHGGKGGRTSGGVTNGSVEFPLMAGSGGGTWNNNSGDYGGWGGGVIRLEVDYVCALEGTLNASGQSMGDIYSGGGAGGSLYLRCGTLSGSGSLLAEGGGARTTSQGSGSGGGGRIAVYRSRDFFTGRASATNGVALAANLGLPGSIFWNPLPTGGAILIIR